MVTGSLARRYARAIVEIGTASGNLDKLGADFQMNLDSMKDRLGCRPVPIQWPVGQEDQLKGMVDLVRG